MQVVSQLVEETRPHGFARRKAKVIVISREQQDDLDMIDAHIGKRIRGRRKELKISQPELGSALGISYQAIQKFETGKTHIAAARLAVIASRLSVDISYFFDGLDVASAATRKAVAMRSEQIELIDLLLSVPAEARKAVIDALKLLLAASAARQKVQE